MNSLMVIAPYKYKGMWVFDVRLCDHWQFGREPFYQRVAAAILAAAAVTAIVVSLRNQVVKTEQAEKALDESLQRAHAILGPPPSCIYSYSRP